MQIVKISFMFLLMFCALFAGRADEEGAVPRIEFASPDHDFGKVDQDSILNHIFKFTNKGNVLLKIHKVKTS